MSAGPTAVMDAATAGRHPLELLDVDPLDRAFALGQKGRLVALARFCQHPRFLPWLPAWIKLAST